MKPETIGIIGGNGKMGSLFKSLFEEEGVKVIISDLDTEYSNIDVAEKSDIVLLSVPIRHTVSVIKEIGEHISKDSLLTDLTSVKILPIRAMKKNCECGILGGHPIFGPMKDVKGQNYIVCDIKKSRYTSWYLSFLKNKGIKVVKTTPEDHDKTMAVVQCLTHMSSINAGYALKKYGFSIEKSVDYSSPVYKIELYMTGRILSQDPELYGDIQMNNPYSREILEIQAEALSELKKAVDNKDSELFEKIFRQTAEYLGSFCEEAKKESDYLIKKLVEK